MIAIISPAQNMDQLKRPDIAMTVPERLEDALALSRKLAAFSPWELEPLLKVNEDIATRAFDYYQDFPEQKLLSPALLSYRGLAYTNIEPQTMTAEDLAYAQDHLRILSALYGILRPLDGIQPHRLDFMGKFKVDGQSLYKHWKDTVYSALFESGQPVVNLCSEEYAKLIRPHLKPWDYLVSCRFMVRKKNKYVCRATEAKMARGKMVRHIIQNRIEDPDDLKGFSAGGYQYSKERSTSFEMVFLQETP